MRIERMRGAIGLPTAAWMAVVAAIAIVAAWFGVGGRGETARVDGGTEVAGVQSRTSAGTVERSEGPEAGAAPAADGGRSGASGPRAALQVARATPRAPASGSAVAQLPAPGEVVLPAALAGLPQRCGRGAEGFGAWVQEFRQRAAGEGLSTRTLDSLDGLTYAHHVISLDRHQHHFKKTFEEFGRPRIAQRIGKARQMLQRHSTTLAGITREFGVPGEVVIAIWALETDFGTVMGHQPALRSIATLAYDCRRSTKFTAELYDALQLIERGDLRPREMKGAWAGELGQTQFLASSYLKYAIDFDRNGKRDLIGSVPDVLASTANYLRGYGWRAGEALEEGSANAEVLRSWNKSSVYQKTIIEFARQLRETGRSVAAPAG